MLLPMLWKRDNHEMCNCNNDPFAEIDRWMNDFWGGNLFDGSQEGPLFAGLKTDVIEKDGAIVLLPLATYPVSYLDDLKSEVCEIREKIASGEQPVFDNIDELFKELDK